MSHDVGALTNYQTCEEGQIIYLGDNNTQNPWSTRGCVKHNNKWHNKRNP